MTTNKCMCWGCLLSVNRPPSSMKQTTRTHMQNRPARGVSVDNYVDNDCVEPWKTPARECGYVSRVAENNAAARQAGPTCACEVLRPRRAHEDAVLPGIMLSGNESESTHARGLMHNAAAPHIRAAPRVLHPALKPAESHAYGVEAQNGCRGSILQCATVAQPSARSAVLGTCMAD